MASQTNTLAGLLLLNDQNMSDVFPTNVLDDAPVIMKAHAQPASKGGTAHQYLRRYTAATVGFRELNTGVDNSAEYVEQVDVTCKILDGSFARDVMLADGYAKGRAAFMQRETEAALKTMMFTLEKAIFSNGTGTQFAGLPSIEIFADTNVSGTRVTDAGGAGGKSVWLCRWGEDALSVIAGNSGRIAFDWNDENPTVTRITTTQTKYYNAYLVTLAGYFGLQVGSSYDVARIANLDGTSDDLLTDDLISTAMSTFPAARPPNMIVMSRTSLKELQQSRTATNPTGAPAPFPSEAFGVPIVVTDSLSDSETTIDATTSTSTTSSSI